MNAIVLEGTVRIPARVRTLSSFRSWARTDEFPERGRFSFLRGELWIDMSPEELYTHNQVKTEFAIVLGRLVKQARTGPYFSGGAMLSNPAADLSTVPDGLFATWRSLKAGRLKHVRGVEGFIEFEGTPDLVLEVVSKNSVRKDTLVLPELYWRAGIPEYWLVDARGERLRFDILRRCGSGYRKSPCRAGWTRSALLKRSFRLVRRKDRLGNPDFSLSVRR